nr:MAG TPA: hypothetical protein [Caudoviricetes sp.]
MTVVLIIPVTNSFDWDSCTNAVPCKSCAEVFVVASCLELFSILRQVSDLAEAFPYERDFVFEFHLFPSFVILAKPLMIPTIYFNRGHDKGFAYSAFHSPTRFPLLSKRDPLRYPHVILAGIVRRIFSSSYASA